MYDPPIVFTAEYSDEVVVQATRAFRDYLFKRYGLFFVLACVVNAFGLWLALHFGAEPGIALAVVVFVVLVGPIWLLYKYFLAPSHQAAKLRQLFPAQSRVSLAAASVSLEVHGRQVEIPWSVVNAVVETGAVFLLVVSPFAFTFIPRRGMPAQASESLHARSRYRAA